MRVRVRGIVVMVRITVSAWRMRCYYESFHKYRSMSVCMGVFPCVCLYSLIRKLS